MAIFTAGLVQLNTQDDIASNLAAVEKYLREAAKAKVQFAMLPENTFYMREPGREGYPDVSVAVAHSHKLAAELGIWILIGSVQHPSPSGKYNNRSILIDDKGNTAAQYDKIHLFDVTLRNGEAYNESSRIEAGGNAMLVNTPWGKLGMSVCYDLRFPHLYRALAKGGADFITIPSAFTYTTGTAHWHALLRARAIENGCYVFAPAQCSYHPGKRRTYGHSLAVSPWGEIIAEAGEEQTGLTLVTADTSKVEEARAMIPSLKHDRPFEVTA